MHGDETASDRELAARVLAGDDRAFTLLMRRTKAALYTFARRYVGDDDLAYDLLQQAYAAAWKALARYDSSRSFEAWMRTIVRNKCRDAQRKAAVRRLINLSPVSPQGHEYDAPTPGQDPEQSLAIRDDLRRTSDALASLPDGLKTPLILTAIEGWTMAQAADHLGLTEKAVETRLYRARKALNEKLGRLR